MEANLRKATLLRPNQVLELEDDIAGLEKVLDPKNSVYVKDLDLGDMYRRLRGAKEMMKQRPPKVIGSEQDVLVKRRDVLLKEILVGMPSQEEMRKNPPGAVDKHINWEKRNKPNINEWKNIQLILNNGTDNQDIANLEKHRPAGSSLSMDNAQIPGQQFYFPPGPIPATNVMSEEDRKKQEDFLNRKIEFLDAKGKLSATERKFFGLEPKKDVEE